MNKSVRFILLLATTLFAAQALFAAEPIKYYNNARGKSDETLMTALRDIIRDHTQLSYNQLWNAFVTTDTDADGYIIDMYSNCRYRPSEHGGNASQVGDGFNREHSFPKSWFNDGYPMYTDLFHMYPTDIRVNNQRGNYPFGVCANGIRLVNGELHGKGKLGASSYPGYTGTVFEPDDEYKGDFARTYFYMVTCYKNELPSWSGSPQLDYNLNKYKAFSTWSINMLMEWTRQDPVSEKEIRRNDAVFGLQGNRNPFIDHPELAEYIWGEMQGQVWNASDQPITPTITAPADGTLLEMGEAELGTHVVYTINVKGEGLTEDLLLGISQDESNYFDLSQNRLTASEVNSGTTLEITFNAQEEGTFEAYITMSSSEVTTIFGITVTAIKPGDTPPPPPVELGDSIMEDWEGCATGGYWTKQVQGNTWKWDFTDAGIWADNLKHGELSCRLGKSSSSAIAMAEDVVGSIGAISFWAASYGNDANANLRVDYSTDQGATWLTLGDFTVIKGILQHVTMDVITDGTVRFRIVQTSGTRVNIDDITVYKRIDEPQPPTPTIMGDVNCDGEVTIADVNAVIKIILNASRDAEPQELADVNGDGEVTIADINIIICIILGTV